jgi:ABC-type glycerol-3-phosphate transport system permease component
MSLLSHFASAKNIRALNQIPKHLPLLVVSALALFPTYFMLASSFKSRIEFRVNALGLPVNPTLSNYTEIIQNENFLIWIRNSVILTLSSVILSVIISALAAYAFSRMRFPGKHLIFNVVVSLMVVPPIVVLIPLFVLMARIGLINTYFSAIIIYVGTLLPFSIYLLTRFFDSVPQELMDSAYIDGASELQTLISILLPLTKPALITLGVVNALYVWNELLIALVFLQQDQLKTLMIGVTLFSTTQNLNIPLVMTGCVLAALPIVTLYVIGQQYFIQGLTEGALRS